MVLLLVSAALMLCAVYLSLDSLRYKANALLKRMQPSLLSWAEAVLALFDGLEGYPLPGKKMTVAEINRLCSAVNEKLALLAKSGYPAEELALRFSNLCGEVFNGVFYYNEAVLAYNKKLAAPLCKAVAGLLRMKAPEKITEFFFQ